MKRTYLILISLLIFFTGCTFGKQEVDLSKYKIKEPDTKSYLLHQKQIVTYNYDERTLTKTTFSDQEGKIYKFYKRLYPVDPKYVFQEEILIYMHRLRQQGCELNNITKCLEKNIDKDLFIDENGSKDYILKKQFGLELFDIVDDYMEFIKKQERKKDRDEDIILD